MHTAYLVVAMLVPLCLAADELPVVAITPEMIKLGVPNGPKYSNGLGYTRHHGNKTLDVFGRAFVASGAKWTKALCSADSDGDGQTNGVELGDPCCKWSPGDAPLSSTTSNPGNPHSKLSNNPSAKELCPHKRRKIGPLHHHQ
ncbi:hypothetical protein ATCC90586_009456 [Pythium insidiosum]|nr:hypothetical protein ATCC90586_009456 [Pythium insidiosum]